MVKVLLMGLGREISARIPLSHAVIPWLISHSAYLRTLMIKWGGGKTAHQRARGAAGPQKLLCCGDVCRYQCHANGGGIAGTKLHWSTGQWLGIDRRTSQYIVYDKTMGGYA